MCNSLKSHILNNNSEVYLCWGKLEKADAHRHTPSPGRPQTLRSMYRWTQPLHFKECIKKVISVALCTELKALCLRVRVSPWSLDCPSTGASSHISIPRAKIADVCHHGQLEVVLKISLWINNHLSWNPTSAQWHWSKDSVELLWVLPAALFGDGSAVWRGGANGLPFCLVCLWRVGSVEGRS